MTVVATAEVLIRAVDTGVEADIKKKVDKAVDGVNKKAKPVKIDVDTKEAESRLSSFGSTLTKVVGTTALLAFARNARDMASDVAEAGSKVGVVFGDARKSIDQFAASSSNSFGISKRAALDATGTFGNLFVATGLAKDAAADMSVDVVKLAADLGSFNNLKTDEVLEKLRSGLVGEVEPLRALGINFDAAAVKAKAMQLGLADANGEISQGALVQARYALIVEQTSTAQGDFARTADGMANSTKSAAAAAEDAQAKFGEALAPVMTKVNLVATDVLNVFTSLPDALQQTLVAAGLLGAGITLLAGRTAAWTLVTKAATAAQTAFSLSLLGKAGAAGALAAGALALNDVTREAAASSSALDKVKSVFIELESRIPVVGEALAKNDEKFHGLQRASRDYSAAVRGSAGATSEQKAASLAASGALDQFGASQAKAKPLTEAETKALEAQREAMDKVTNATLSAVSSQLGYQSSLNTLKDNINDIDDRTTEYAEAVDKSAEANREAEKAVRLYGAGSDEAKEATDRAKDAAKEAEQANRALRDAHLGVEQSALQTAASMLKVADDAATMAGKTLTAQEKAHIFRNALVELADQASGPTKQAILDLADQVLGLPDSKTIYVDADTSAASAAIASLQRQLNSIEAAGDSTSGAQQFARGLEAGPVRGRPGEAVPVIAHAGERFITNEQLARLRAGAPVPQSLTTSTLSASTALTISGPLVVVQGGVAPGQEASIGAAVKQAVTQLVADGTVGRAMSKRSQTYSTR